MNKHINVLIAGACVVIIVAGMHLAAAVLNPFLLALMLAACLMPILNWQLRKGWPRGLAIALTIPTVLLGGILLQKKQKNLTQRREVAKDRKEKSLRNLWVSVPKLRNALLFFFF